MEKVLLGMSGGVDSTAAAYLLARDGYDVTGINFIMYGDPEEQTARARAAADQAGIGLITADVRELFRARVIVPFADLYAAALTPNPCVLCNRRVKFPLLLEQADRLGCERIATGHYAAVGRDGNGYFIRAAADPDKDQSYFLYALGQDVLSRLLLPLSGLKKTGVRELAARQGFTAAAARDSQDVCFIPDGDHGAFLRAFRPGIDAPGSFTDTEGRVLGSHRGITGYTVGQRRGLGIASDAPLYVRALDPERNRVILCREAELYASSVTVCDCVYPGDAPAAPFRADVRLRYTRKSAPALVTPLGGGCCRVDFDGPQRAPAPGQAAVFFSLDPDRRVLGGGQLVRAADGAV